MREAGWRVKSGLTHWIPLAGGRRLPELGVIMRDRRFVAVHRGGPLSKEDHRRLAAWAADCVERLLPVFEQTSEDPRPRAAVAVARAWARGEVPVGQAQKAAVAAHAAAREAAGKAVAAARAAGHAVATAHMAEHSLGAVIYGLKAIEQSEVPAEHAWQLSLLPEDLRELVASALARRLPGRFPIRME